MPKSVPLPQISAPGRRHSVWKPDDGPRRGAPFGSRRGWWRAGVLGLIHVIIIIHIIHWMVVGMTLSPVEPSESMQTLREGVVNAGFVMFALAILSTLILGRFFCGWACHVVALQDLSAWLLAKVRVKPKPFRSRLLIWVPLLVALYMFVWPVFHREVVRPIVADERGRMPAWLGQSEPLTGFGTEFFVEDFWATFPPWYIAIPFFFVIGFAAVYFLGSKGFCTYGCPYGGFFAPADVVAPGRIRVTDDCEHCGHCTAVCTSNVRVHEEVRDFGMVVDPGCMKCMDCVRACPNDALYFGFGKPAAGAKPRSEEARKTATEARARRESRYDLSRREELLAAGVFALGFFAYRQMFDQIPMLMAVGIAGVVTFIVWKTWRLLLDHSVRLQSLQLKIKGRVTAWGYLTAVTGVACLAVAFWSASVRLDRYRADLIHAGLTVPVSVMLRPDYEPSAAEAAQAQRLLDLYRRANRPSEGGRGWEVHPDNRVQMAYALLLLGQREEAAGHLDRLFDRGNPRDELVYQKADILRSLGADPSRIRETFERALDSQADLFSIRADVARATALEGDTENADAAIDAMLDEHPRSRDAVVAAANYHLALGRSARASELADRLASEHARDADALLAAARIKEAVRRTAEALPLARRASMREPRKSHVQMAYARALARSGDRTGALEAVEAALRAAERRPILPSTLTEAALLTAQLGDPALARERLDRAAVLVGDSPWELYGVAQVTLQLGAGLQSPEIFNEGIQRLRSATELLPDSPVLFADLASAAYSFDLPDLAVTAMTRAVELASASPAYAQRLADLHGELGHTEEQARWSAEAQRRRGAGPAAPVR